MNAASLRSVPAINSLPKWPGGRLLTTVSMLSCGLVGPITSAQVRSSELGRISQVIDGTTVSIEYYCPIARGRRLFGGLVRWGDIWTPGANWATTIEVDREVSVNNRPLPAGRYSIWMIPEEGEEWQIVLSRMARAFHLWPPIPEHEQMRLKIRTQPCPYSEVLTWSFPAISRDGVLLRFQWGTTQVQMHLSVGPSRPPATSPDSLANYLGDWIADARLGGDAQGRRFQIIRVGERLRVIGPAVSAGVGSEFELVPIGGHHFHPVSTMNGQSPGTDRSITIAFELDGPRAVALVVLGPALDTLARAFRPLEPPGQ